MSNQPLNLTIDLADADVIIPQGLVTESARFLLLLLGFDFIGSDADTREDLTFVQQYDSRRQETVRNLRIILKKGAHVEDVQWAIHDAGWCAHKQHVNRARDAYLLALNAPPEHKQIGLPPSQQGPNILAQTMPS